MSEEINKIISDTEASMLKALNHLEAELVKIRAGKANPNMLDGIMADYYGNPTAINQIANISVLDARTISVQPWEKNMLQAIERAITMANIGINPQNDGNIIRLFLPPLTEERRKELVKLATKLEKRISFSGSWTDSQYGTFEKEIMIGFYMIRKLRDSFKLTNNIISTKISGIKYPSKGNLVM